MKRLTLVFAMLAICSLQLLLAQTRQITGVVTSSQDGSPLPGASVAVKGTTIGTITAIDGSYELNIPENASTLVVSFVGMKTSELPIEGRSEMDVALDSDLLGIEEVMVVAYGTTKKYSFTGSASNIGADVVENKPVSDITKALQGSAAGLQITSASGQPGSASEVRIRGFGSVTASSDPLYVVDGVAITSGNYSEIANDDNYGTSADVLSTLNPNDIESINVLKDAAAASLYGSRAANGVIIITTKQGKSGKTRFEAFAQTGISERAVDGYDLMDAATYYQHLWKGIQRGQIERGSSPQAAADYADGLAPGIAGRNPYNIDSPFDADGNLKPEAEQIIDADWQDAVYRTGVTNEYGVSATGGNDNTSFYLSGGYYNQEGIVIGSDFERFTGKLNLSNQATDFLKIGMNNTLGYTVQNTPPGALGAANPGLFANIIPGTNPIFQVDENGDPILIGGQKVYDYNNPVQLDFNPVGLAKQDIYSTKTGRVLSSAFAELTLFRDITLKSILSVDYLVLNDQLYYNPEHGNGATVGGRSQVMNHDKLLWTTTNTALYSKDINESHRVDILIGQEALKSGYRFIESHATNFPFGGVTELRASATPVTTDSYLSEFSLVSYFSRINYDFRDKYYLSASYRRDGSSRFGAENQFGDFYSVGAAWRVSEESFIDNTGWLNSLRLRTSFGTSGNNEIGNYAAKGLYSYGYNYSGVPGMVQTQLANPILTWEKNTSLDIGIEFGLFGTFTGNVTYYNKVSDGLLLEDPLSMTTGFENITTNIGEVKNTGVEVELSNINIQTSDWTWITSFNITANQNEWTSLPQDQIINGSKLWKVGNSIYEYYIREWAGVDPATGEAMWYTDVLDAEGNPTGERTLTKDYGEAVRYEQGDAAPDFFGGFTSNLSWRNFDFDFTFYFSYGGLILDQDYQDIMHDGSVPSRNLSNEALEAWQQPGDVTHVPKYVYQNDAQSNDRSTRFLHDASYLRLRNATLSYNLPSSILNRVNIASARVFVQADNYLTIAAYKGRDPETRLSGNTNWDIPIPKTVTFGLKLGL